MQKRLSWMFAFFISFKSNQVRWSKYSEFPTSLLLYHFEIIFWEFWKQCVWLIYTLTSIVPSERHFFEIDFMQGKGKKNLCSSEKDVEQREFTKSSWLRKTRQKTDEWKWARILMYPEICIMSVSPFYEILEWIYCDGMQFLTTRGGIFQLQCAMTRH